MQGIHAPPRSKEAIELIKKMNQNTQKGVVQALQDVGKRLVSTSKELILDKNKNGRVYKNVPYRSTGKGARKIVKRRHQASAPGEAPANLSGNLWKSLNFTRQGSTQLSFGNTAEYSAVLEFGGRKVAPRPYMKRSIDLNKKDIENLMRSRVISEITKGGPE